MESELTVWIKASSGSYLGTSEPHNGNCWTDRDKALVLSLRQARVLLKLPLLSRCSIEICTTFDWYIDDSQFEHEYWCLETGKHWSDYKEIK